MEIKRYVCDICKKNEALERSMQLQVIFTTEQTEGRSTKPYLYTVKVDICATCLAKILAGNYVWAYGAQGANTYVFTKAK